MVATSARGSIRRKSSGDGIIRAGDRISALPDDVIHLIFRSLPFEEVVKTTVLSKRWRSTWTNTTHLAFDGKSCDSWDFGSFVDSIRIRFTSPTVKTLHVTNLRYNEIVRSELDSCLSFVKERHVEEIRLSFSAPLLYALPTSLYCLSSLVSLEVSSSCRFSLDGTISWPRLKVLSVERVELSEDVLKRIFMGSPLLESLKLCDCTRLKNIIIDASSLKELILIGNFCNVEKIWAPHLLSLRVFGNWWSKFRLDDVSSLVEAQLDFVFETLAKRIQCCHLVKELFEKLQGVRTITISSWCLQVLSVLEMQEAPSLLSKCQNLILHAGVSRWDLPGIAYMLRSSQCLEKLDIHLTGDHSLKLKLDKGSKERFKFDEEDFLCSRKGNFQCLSKHLKRVEITGSEAHSSGSKYLHALIKFIHGDTHLCWRR